MPTANIHRRDSIESIYPADAFASDAARNGQVTNQIICGVRILSAPNGAGEFSFARGNRHVAEAPSSTFLAPYRREKGRINADGEHSAAQSISSEPHAGYEEFLAEIVAVARQFGFDPEESPGRDEPRLQGLRQ
jgi:hypothetical protein